MERRLTFKPRHNAGWTPEALAQTFAAYLMGARAHENQRDGRDDLRYGPFLQGEKWQLDGSNDYWLRVEGDTVHLDCRYTPQVPMIEAMLALFLVSYGGERVQPRVAGKVETMAALENAERIKDLSPTLGRVEPADVAAALGAEETHGIVACPFCRDRARTAHCKVCDGTGRIQRASALLYRDVMDRIDDMTPEQKRAEKAWIDEHCGPISPGPV